MFEEDTIIKFENACIANSDAPVLYDLNFSINKGDFAYIVGRVGSGKTSIIRTLTAENRLYSGKCTVCGYDLTTIRSSRIPEFRRMLGVVFQDFQLLMDKNVHDNLEFVLKCTGWKKDEKREDRIRKVLKSVGMETKAHKMPFQLSGGEQQRVAIARAILNLPSLIIADEPTGNLDNDTADGIMTLLRKINEVSGAAVVMVTHNTQIVEKYPGRVFECRDEKCLEITGEEVVFEV